MDVTPEEIRVALRTYNVRAAFAVQDRLPREWRELIYAYGQLKVLALLAKGYDLETARDLLRCRRY